MVLAGAGVGVGSTAWRTCEWLEMEADVARGQGICSLYVASSVRDGEDGDRVAGDDAVDLSDPVGAEHRIALRRGRAQQHGGGRRRQCGGSRADHVHS
eukprot:SAG31_NODE_2445_length_5681_cov_18.644930_6_plen_98_part_00